jgi:arylsulfatase A-like enzyme
VRQEHDAHHGRTIVDTLSNPHKIARSIGSHYGGIANPLLVSWPKRIPASERGSIRTQWSHVNDIGKAAV